MSQNFLQRIKNERPKDSYMRNCSVEDYNSDPGWRRSEMVDFDKAPRCMLTRKRTTPEMQTGINFHSYFLTRDDFNRSFIFEPKEFEGKDKRKNSKTGGCKEDYDLWKKSPEIGGREILSSKIEKKFKGMSESIMSHPPTKKILEKSMPEISCFSYLDGVPVKVRVDMERFVEEPVLVDIKTTSSAYPGANFEEIQRVIMNYKYYRQAAFYLDIYNHVMETKATKFLLVFIEKEEPFMGLSVMMNPEWIEKGRQENQDSLENFKRWLDSGSEDTFYSIDIESVPIPSWASPRVGIKPVDNSEIPSKIN